MNENIDNQKQDNAEEAARKSDAVVKPIKKQKRRARVLVFTPFVGLAVVFILMFITNFLLVNYIFDNPQMINLSVASQNKTMVALTLARAGLTFIAYAFFVWMLAALPLSVYYYLKFRKVDLSADVIADDKSTVS